MASVKEKMDENAHRRIYVERTLALIKPDAIHRSEEIEDVILKSGFTVLQVGSKFLVWKQR